MNKELLTRIEALETLTERLELEIKDLRNSCLCLAPLESIDEPIPNCEPPTCEDCGSFDCMCDDNRDDRDIDEEPREQEPNEEVEYD